MSDKKQTDMKCKHDKTLSNNVAFTWCITCGSIKANIAGQTPYWRSPQYWKVYNILKADIPLENRFLEGHL